MPEGRLQRTRKNYGGEEISRPGWTRQVVKVTSTVDATDARWVTWTEMPWWNTSAGSASNHVRVEQARTTQQD